MLVPTNLNDLQSLAASVARLGRGLKAWTHARQPELPIELYEFEACPYCRKVREAFSELDLDYVSRTCARGAKTREAAIALGGKRQFPLMSDRNTGKVLYESEAIIDYLWATYGDGRPRWSKALAPLDTLSSMAASLVRTRGLRVRDDSRERVQPKELLVLWNFDASPYCRKAREALSELDLHAHVKNVAKGGARRPELVARGGKMQVPYLEDPNTGAALYESDDIVAYLVATYGKA
ncbi:MAG: glutathione S-transferase N-terminal domain-containing protein [Myxococcota bacterium]